MGHLEVIKPDGSLDGTGVIAVAYNGSINFTLADGATDFVAGDYITVPVTQTGASKIVGISRRDDTLVPRHRQDVYPVKATAGIVTKGTVAVTCGRDRRGPRSGLLHPVERQVHQRGRHLQRPGPRRPVRNGFDGRRARPDPLEPDVSAAPPPLSTAVRRVRHEGAFHEISHARRPGRPGVPQFPDHLHRDRGSTRSNIRRSPIPGLVPVDTSAPEWIKTVTYYVDGHRRPAKWVNGAARDIPLAELNRAKGETGVELAAIGYGYNLEEISQASMLNMNLTTDKATARARLPSA
jgi:hypothetical protein